MAAAAADLEERTAVSTPSAPTPVPIPFPSESERTAGRQRTSPATWILRIAAVVAIVGLVGYNLLLQNQLNASQAYQESVAAVLDVAAQPGSLTAILTPADGSGSGLAAVGADGAVTLAMRDMAPTTGSTVYTAWAIGGDGVPVPLGDFTVGNDGNGSLQAVTSGLANGTVLALTHEPTSGAVTPTLPIISKGVATAPA